MMNNMKLNYNDWMAYIYNTIHSTKETPIKKTNIGERSIKEIQKEIEELKRIDKLISDKVRTQYSIKNEN